MLEVYICVGSSCHLKGSYPVIKRFQELVEQYGLQDKVEIKASFCLGHCTRGVSVKVGEEFMEDLTLSNLDERFRQYVLERKSSDHSGNEYGKDILHPKAAG